MEEKEVLPEEGEKKNKSGKAFLISAISEAIILLGCLFVCRMWAFPKMAETGELHTRIALECLGIGMTATIFALFALTVKKAWKTKGGYIVYPLIFLLFALGLMMAVNEVNFG